MKLPAVCPRVALLGRPNHDSACILTSANARVAASLTRVLVLSIGFFVAQTLLIPALALLCGNLIENYIIVRAARRFDPALPVLPKIPTDRGEIRRAFRDGAAALAINLSTTIALRVDLFDI